MDTTTKAVLFILSFGALAYLAGNKDIPLLRLTAVALVLLALVSWFLSTFLVPYFEGLQERQEAAALPVTPSDVLERRRREAVERMSAAQSDKELQFVARQAERQRLRLDSQDKSLHQFSPAYKGHGETISSQLETRQRRGTSAIRSAQPGQAVSDNAPAEMEKEINIEVSPEPEANSSSVATVSFRLPNNKAVKRRFKSDCSLLQLYAYSESLGYPPSSHCLYAMTVPRKLVPCEDTPLSSIQPGRGIVVIVEEKDESDEESSEQ